MKKNVLFALLILIIFVLLYAKNYNLNLSIKEEKIPLYENMTNIFLSSDMIKNYWGEYDCKIALNDSIINVLYIRKEGNNTAFDCFTGPFYSRVSEENKIRCTEEEINKIYTAVYKKNNCTFPLANPLPNDVREFYSIKMACNVLKSQKQMNESNESFYTKTKPICPKSGYYSIFYFVADPETKKIYY